VIPLRYLDVLVTVSNARYVSLPLALAGFGTAVIFGVQWLAKHFPDRDQDSHQHQSFSTGATQ
jgi:hypothetical protein